MHRLHAQELPLDRLRSLSAMHLTAVCFSTLVVSSSAALPPGQPPTPPFRPAFFESFKTSLRKALQEALKDG